MTDPNESYNAAKTIKQTCDDLVSSYETLAKTGHEHMGNIGSTIGQMYQWEYDTYCGSQHLGIEYRDTRMAWYEKMVVRAGGMSFIEKHVEHPRREEARKALADAQGVVDDVDEKFDLDSKDIRDTVGSVGNHMSGWVDVASGLTKLVFASEPSQIPTSGDTLGWKSPTALSTYSTNVKNQRSARDTTEEVIRTMLERDAEFLKSMSTMLSDFATLQREETDAWIGLATGSWKPDKLTMDWVLGKIGEVSTFVTGFKDRQIKTAESMINSLNSAVTSVLKTEELRGKINKMSEPGGGGGVGWPYPSNNGAAKTEGGTNFDQIKFQAQYFRDHIKYWDQMHNDFGPVVGSGKSAQDIEPMFLRFPAFSATAASGLNALSGELKNNALTRGESASDKMARALEGVISDYLKTEELNEEQSKEIEKILTE